MRKSKDRSVHVIGRFIHGRFRAAIQLPSDSISMYSGRKNNVSVTVGTPERDYVDKTKVGTPEACI
jgi:hypothetical protein